MRNNTSVTTQTKRIVRLMRLSKECEAIDVMLFSLSWIAMKKDKERNNLKHKDELNR